MCGRIYPRCTLNEEEKLQFLKTGACPECNVEYESVVLQVARKIHNANREDY